MNNSVFGELVFNIGWKASADISLLNNDYSVIVKAKAYHEQDGITAEQEAAIIDFGDNKQARLATVDKLLTDYANGEDASKRFIPRTLLFQRNGSYALLLDDNEDEDEGIAVCLAPAATIVSQSEYL